MKKAINTNYPVKFANRPFTTLYLQPKHHERLSTHQPSSDIVATVVKTMGIV